MKNRSLNNIIPRIENNTIGKTLFLNNKRITDEQITKIALALKKNTTVEEICLSDNLITDAGVVALTECMKFNKNVQKIDIKRNLVEDTNLIITLKNELKRNKKTYKDAQVGTKETNEKRMASSPKSDPLVAATMRIKQNITKLKERIGYKFDNEALFEKARTIGRNKDLEKLGDALLEVIVTMHGIDKEKCTNEYISSTQLAKMLKPFFMSQSNKNMKTDEGNAVEAMIGAIFIDSNESHKAIEEMFFRTIAERADCCEPDIKQLGVALRKYACVRIARYNCMKKDRLEKQLKNTYGLTLLNELAEMFLKSHDYSGIVRYVESKLAPKKAKTDIPNKKERRDFSTQLDNFDKILLGTAAAAAAVGAGLAMWEQYRRDDARSLKKMAASVPNSTNKAVTATQKREETNSCIVM